MENQTNGKIEHRDNNSIQYIYHPSEAWIKNWTLWMACEVVSQWQTASAIELKQDILNPTPKVTLSTNVNWIHDEIIQNRRAN